MFLTANFFLTAKTNWQLETCWRFVGPTRISVGACWIPVGSCWFSVGSCWLSVGFCWPLVGLRGPLENQQEPKMRQQAPNSQPIGQSGEASYLEVISLTAPASRIAQWDCHFASCTLLWTSQMFLCRDFVDCQNIGSQNF